MQTDKTRQDRGTDMMKLIVTFALLCECPEEVIISTSQIKCVTRMVTGVSYYNNNIRQASWK
jgi:hypothetical protein